MISYFVRYEDLAGNTEEFMRYYRDVHVPILARWPGVTAIYLHTPAGVEDAHPTTAGGASLMAQIVFASEADLAAALTSAERAQARVDFGQFPPFSARVTHQAMHGEAILRGAAS